MKIKSIDLDDEGCPKKITCTLTVAEATWIARQAGGTSEGEIPYGIYASLTGDLFNRFWGDGVAGAERGDEVSR